jgi:hypothetical protein
MFRVVSDEFVSELDRRVEEREKEIFYATNKESKRSHRRNEDNSEKNYNCVCLCCLSVDNRVTGVTKLEPLAKSIAAGPPIILIPSDHPPPPPPEIF